MAGILCSCKVPWRIAVLDGKSVELCPVCGAWRESAWQVGPGLWQGDTRPPTEGRERPTGLIAQAGGQPGSSIEGSVRPRELPSFPSRAAAIRRLRLEAAGCLGAGVLFLAVAGWVVWLVIS